MNTTLAPTLISQVTKQLRGKCIDLRISNLDSALTAYSLLYRRLNRLSQRFISTLEDYENIRDKEGWENGTNQRDDNLKDDFLQVVYTAAEIFEFYESHIPALFAISKDISSIYMAEIKSFRREVAIICNRSKHNHAFLQTVEVVYENKICVVGFCLYEIDDGSLKPNANLHRKREAFSYNFAIKRLFSNLLLADFACGNLISRIPDGDFPSINVDWFHLPVINELKRVVDRDANPMPRENTTPSVTLDETFFFTVHDIETTIQSEMYIMRVYIDIIAKDVSVEIPYFLGTGRARVSTEDLPHPLGIELRQVIEIKTEPAAPSVS